MNARTSVGKVVVLLAIVCASAALVRAAELDLHAKLGEPIKIQLKNVTIVEALAKIGQKAGVKFVLSDEAEWKLPQGKATRLSVTMDGALANSVTEMLNAFFMRYVIGDDAITIYPRPKLDHILGRPTAKQLELLILQSFRSKHWIFLTGSFTKWRTRTMMPKGPRITASDCRGQ
ncbi:MAG: hypothetical protein ACYS29_10390 [Planctomycetota bacterium]|jgi:hypothetical protein